MALTVVAVGWAWAVSPAAAFDASANRLAVHEYLVAFYDYDRAIVANAGASRAALNAMAKSVDSKCAEVMSRSRRKRTLGSLWGRSRRQGRRIGEQIGYLEEEPVFVARGTVFAPDHAAGFALAARVRALRWSNRTLAREARGTITTIEEERKAPVPNVCADMKAWAASRYSRLPASTKVFLRQREARDRRFAYRTKHHERLVITSLPPRDRAGDRALYRRIRAVVRRADRSLKKLDGVEQEMMRKTGLLEAF